MKGAAKTKAKRKEVDSQFIVEALVEKYVAAVLATGENESQSQLTTILSSTNCISPNHLLL